MFTFLDWLDELIKGHGHRYIKRIPYMTPKGRRYRYIYKVHHRHQGKHILDPKDMKEGAKFMVHSESGKEVHAHITKRLGNTVTFVYDDGEKKGQTETVHVDRLAKLIDDAVESRKVLENQINKVKKDLAQAMKTGSAKQRARLQAQLDKLTQQLADRTRVLEDEDDLETITEDEKTLDEMETAVDEADVSHLSQEQQVNGIQATKEEQIQRRDFKKWFKNSVVVGENGEPAEQWGSRPVRVYHGTARGGFSSFSKEADKGSNIFGKGFYFTADKEIATEYSKRDVEEVGSDANPEVFEVFLSLQNPVDMRKEVDEAEFASMCKHIHEAKLEELQKRVDRDERDLKEAQKVLDTFTVLSDVNTSGEFGYYHERGSFGEPDISIQVERGEKIPKGYAMVGDLYNGKMIWRLMPEEDVENSKKSNEIKLQREQRQLKRSQELLAHSKAVIAGTEKPTIPDSYLKMYSIDDEKLLGDPSDPLSLERLQRIKTHLKSKTVGKTYKDHHGRTMQVYGGLHIEPTDKLTWQDLYYIATDGHYRQGFEKRFRAWAESTGKDGIIHTGGYSTGTENHEVFVAWEPNQIKATNAKYFNPDSTDIYNGDGVTRPEGGTGLPISTGETESADNFETMPETESADNFETMPEADASSEQKAEAEPEVKTEAEPEVKEPTKTKPKTREKKAVDPTKPRAPKAEEEKLEKPRPQGDFIDVGTHVWGSRADQASLNRADLEKMNPKDVAKEAKRDKLIAWNGLNKELEEGEAKGHTASAVILKDALIKLIPSAPFKYKGALTDRKGNVVSTDQVGDFIDAIDFFIQSLDKCKTALDVAEFVEEFELLTSGYDASSVKVFHGADAYQQAEEYKATLGGKADHHAEYHSGLGVVRVVKKKLSYEQSNEFGKIFYNLAGVSANMHHFQVQKLPLFKTLDSASALKQSIEDPAKSYRIMGSKAPKAFKMAVDLAIKLKGKEWGDPTVTEELDKLGAKKSRKAPRRRAYKFIRNVGEVSRIGGKEIKQSTSTILQKELNLTNIQYGNWMDEKSREIHTKHCHQAFSDFADVLGVDMSELSLSGRLSLGFGARGKGKASAHYEPSSKIINLTKFAGGGSLAHEWGHFLDNVLADVVGITPTKDTQVMLSDGFTVGQTGKGSPALQSAVANVMNAILYAPLEKVTEADYEQKKTEYKEAMSALYAIRKKHDAEQDPEKKENLRIEHNEQVKVVNKKEQTRSAYFQMWKESGRGMQLKKNNPSRFVSDSGNLQRNKNGYWTRPHELFARAFESYIEDELHSKNRQNSYLVSGTRDQYDTGMQSDHVNTGSQPYPQGEERTRINQAMRELISVIKKENWLQKALIHLDSQSFTFTSAVDQLLKGLR
jgi:hypothetical protein